MAKVFQTLVPDNSLVSRIIGCENQVTELYVIDRADKKFVSEHSAELNKPALYILINRDKKMLYVGETEDSLKRLKNHESKDFWTEAIVFHSNTASLSTTEVKWLEATTYQYISDLGYYDLSENKVKPQMPPLKKYQDITLQPYFEQVLEYACAAGFDIFLKKKDKKKDEEEKRKDNLIPCFYKRNADAKGLLNPETEELIVMEGSKINIENLPNLKPNERLKRKDLIAKFAEQIGEYYVLKENISFKSPSGAAKFCCGGASNGWSRWKDENRKPISNYRRSKKG